jgi:hypothetical protein
MSDEEPEQQEQGETAEARPQSGVGVPSGRGGDGEDTGQDRPAGQNHAWMKVFAGLILLIICLFSFFSWVEWSAMRNALAESRRTQQLESRAYVTAKDASEFPQKDNPAWAKVVVTSLNTGRTPAVHLQFESILEHRDTAVPEETVINQRDWSGKTIVFAPFVEVTTAVGRIETKAAGTLRSPSQGRKTKPTAKQGDETVPAVPGVAPAGEPQATSGSGNYVYGIIEYDDIFRVHHWTKFCFFNLPGTTAWSRCSTFNETD